jgi:hypothetical protein
MVPIVGQIQNWGSGNEENVVKANTNAGGSIHCGSDRRI